jgi:hypothetical protein
MQFHDIKLRLCYQSLLPRMTSSKESSRYHVSVIHGPPAECDTVIWPNFGSPKYFGKWRKQGVHFFCEVLCGPWCTDWAQSGLNFFRIELTSLGSHSTLPWTPLNTMAPCKRNFGSPNETLEDTVHHHKSGFNMAASYTRSMSHWVGNSEFPILVCSSPPVVQCQNSNWLFQWGVIAVRLLGHGEHQLNQQFSDSIQIVRFVFWTISRFH